MISTPWVQIWKDILSPISFCKVFRFWKLPNCPCSGLYYERFEDFNHIADSVIRIIYSLRISRATKSFQNELRQANRIGRINFVQCDIVQNLQVFIFFFPQKLFGQSVHSGLCPDIRAVLFIVYHRWLFCRSNRNFVYLRPWSCKKWIERSSKLLIL